MGNSESQYTFQGAKSHSSALPGAKPGACSLKVRSILAKDDKSLQGWGHICSSGGSLGTPSYKSRSLARSCLSHFKTSQPYASRLPGGSGCKAPKGGACCKLKPGCLPGGGGGDLPENGFPYLGRQAPETPSAPRDCNGHPHQHVPCSGRVEDPESPRVRIKTLGKPEGGPRVEFHNGGGPGGDGQGPAWPGDSGGPVRLLRYSPTPGPGDPQRRCSEGSSLSSESSWYDSPWGPLGEAGEPDGQLPPAPPRPGPPAAPQPVKQSASLCSLRELGPGPGLSPRVSFASDLDVAARGGRGDPGPYASFTLPCRGSGSGAPGRDAPKKDSLKARMRRLSDWTGSLSRKKRKLQESRSKEGSDFFDSHPEGLHWDPPGSSAGASSALWSTDSAQLLPQRSESSQALGSTPLRQKVYENFMRELALSRVNPEPGDTSSEAGDTSSESLSSLEQLDLLFEKEQGVVRKAGWLFFKPLVTLQKERKLELVARRRWRHFWVTLKGCTLLFYETYGKNSSDQSSAPRCALFAEDSIVQSVPEHPKKENVFCLSNSFGDVYLFQASSQTDLENWVTAIHSACASLFAKKRGKEDTVRLLRSQARHLAQKIDMDSKMRKMAELQLSVVSDPKNRKAIENQIQQWEQNLEKFHMDLFRTRCYLASLQGGELPNPKSLLAAASRPSKLALGRLGVLSVSSFHALVCSREDSALRRRTRSLSHQGRSKKSLFSSLKGLDTLARKAREKRPSLTQVDELLKVFGSAVDGAPRDGPWETQTYVHLPDNQGISLVIRPEHRVQDVLSLACKMRQLEPSLHGLRLRRSVDETVESCVPGPYEYMQEQVYDEVEVFPLSVYDVQLTKTGDAADFGFAVTAQMDKHQHLCRIFISDVLPDSLAFGEGLRKGNEIMTLNGEAVTDLDLKQMEALFSEKSVGLTLLARPPDDKGTLCSSWSDNSDLVSSEQRSLLPPANQSQLLEEFLDNLKRNSTNDFSNVPSITTGLRRSQTDGTLDQVSHRDKAEQLYKSTEQIATLCGSFADTRSGDMEGPRDSQDPPIRPLARHLSDADRLRKVIQELVDTEKSYVKDLSCLFELYLEPLQNETFLTQDEMESLFGSLPEMLEFQKVFLETLEDGIAASSDFSLLETPSQFRKLLFSLGGSFLYYADHFKLYSGFCANHIKVQKVLERARTDRAFKAFLDARNPTKQHSSTLESYLIKPVQRVLKYPLLLKELVSLTDHDSEEHYHLTEALKAMEKVASHINEMQKIYEDYGTVFDQLVAEQSGTEKEVTELSMGELLTHSTVSWLNPFLSLGKARKDLELTVFVFKRAVILVYKENCKLKKKLPSNSRPGHSSADFDPFKFRWLIPISALQVRLGNTAGTENSSVWELIHTKSEVEGRPETIFQLCCRDCESKTSIVKVIRSILRENFRRHIKCEQPLEKACRDRLGPLKNRVPVSAKLASSRSLKVLRNSSSSEWPGEPGKGSSLDSDEGSLSSSTPSSCQDPLKHPTSGTDFPDGLVKESDILSDEEEDEEDDDPRSLKRASPTKDIEIQFQRLSISEEPDAQPEEGQAQPKLVRAHFCPIKRKANSTRRDRGTLLRAQARHQSLDSQPESAGLDLSSALHREFSVQSLASVVNEECFYEAEGHAKS